MTALTQTQLLTTIFLGAILASLVLEGLFLRWRRDRAAQGDNQGP